jgi:di/tripeptidase
MYYEEKLINGIWHWRGSQTEEFKRMDEDRLRGKIDRMQQQLTEANRRGDALVAALLDLRDDYKHDSDQHKRIQWIIDTATSERGEAK